MNLTATTANTLVASTGASNCHTASTTTSSSTAPLLVPPGSLPGSLMLDLLNAQQQTSGDSQVESEIERKFFRGGFLFD